MDDCDRADRHVQELREEFHAARDAQAVMITALQPHLSFLEDQMDAMHRANIVVQPPVVAVLPEVIDITGDNDIIDLTDDDDGSSSEGTLVEIEGIGGLIEYIRSHPVFNHPSQEELEQVRAIWGSPILEEDFSGMTAAADQEADMIVRVSIAALSYECPPPYLPLYEQVEYCLQ